jgi:hypothetical protein
LNKIGRDVAVNSSAMRLIAILYLAAGLRGDVASVSINPNAVTGGNRRL